MCGADPRRGPPGPFNVFPIMLLESLFIRATGGNPPCGTIGESAVISVRRPELRFVESFLAALNLEERF